MAKLNNSKSLTTFTKFSELIPEIRLVIWEFILDVVLPPRVIEIFSTCDSFYHNKNNTKSRSGGGNAEFYTETSYPIALCINRESRELGLKRYELLEARRDERLLFRTWIRYSKDTIYIHPFHLANGKLWNDNHFMKIVDLFLVYSDAREKIQRLAISQFCFPYGARPVSGLGCVLAFKGLRDEGLVLTVGDVCCGGRRRGGAEIVGGGRADEEEDSEEMGERLHRKVLGFSKAKRYFHSVEFWKDYRTVMRQSFLWAVQRGRFPREWVDDVLDLEKVETRICVVQREVKLAFFERGAMDWKKCGLGDGFGCSNSCVFK